MVKPRIEKKRCNLVVGLGLVSVTVLRLLFAFPSSDVLSENSSLLSRSSTSASGSEQQVTATATNKTSNDEESKRHHCLNDDFHPENKVGVFTLLYDDKNYVKGAGKLGKAVLDKTNTSLDLVAMELQHKPLPNDVWDKLKRTGYKKCTISPIHAPDDVIVRVGFEEKFAVLHVWGMQVYETVVFLDADTFAQNGIDDLIHMDLNGKALGATIDLGHLGDMFNSGVLLLHPSQKEYERLVEYLYSGRYTGKEFYASKEYNTTLGDQGFLNVVYKNNWHDFGFVNNAQMWVYNSQSTFWNQHKLEDINIIHYTIQKPWMCSSRGPYGPICNIWINAPYK